MWERDVVDGAALRMEQSAENQATTCSICRDDGRRSLLEVLRSAPARTMGTVTIIAITAETPGESARAARIHPALSRTISMQI